MLEPTTIDPPEISQEPPEPEPPSPPERSWIECRGVRCALIATAAFVAISGIIFSYYYLKFAHFIDRKLEAGPFADTINIYAAPQTIARGDAATPADIVTQLRRSGYTNARGNAVGWFHERPGALEIFPGRSSYFDQEPGVLYFTKGKISRIVSLQDNTEREEYLLEPQLITNLSDRNREKRRLVPFADIPSNLVHAVISVEDKHFFQHTGFDVLRILKAAYIDAKDGRKEQGASTLSMQLARGLWLDPDKNWKRKLQEMLITMHLEERLSKQQIFEYYANQVYLGRRGTFGISGFGEGAQTFFGKDISKLTDAEAATLAGLVQRPSYYNPFRYPARALERRNVVLALMRQNGYLDTAKYNASAAAPLGLAPEESDSIDAQYFVDLVNDQLQNRGDLPEGSRNYVYTTLDWNLQHAADEAIHAGMKQVDRLLHRMHKKHPIPPGQPQVALIALDPQTGAIKALSGGRNYRLSQLNHVLASRQPGSVFKPFVYAAALDTAVGGGQQIFTPATVVSGEDVSITFNGEVYNPGNFHHEEYGDLTLREALAHSVNTAAVKLAEMVGYRKVVEVARRAGLNDRIQPTPAVALGAYEATPLEIAGAYTIFANKGVYVKPSLVSMVRTREGKIAYQNQTARRQALDPRVAYLMTDLMEEVLRSGTGAGVWSRGVKAPAAGKTGTSRDGWFAGYTSNLLCVVWVGFDDNRDLNIEGAKSALPVWAEFMKRAARLRDYRDVHGFKAPAGIVSATICPESGELAGPYCPNPHAEQFIDGTQPVETCPLHSLPVASDGNQNSVSDVLSRYLTPR